MGLRQNILTEPVEKLSLRKAIVLDSVTPVRDAIRRMREEKLGSVVVAGDDGRPVGIFSEGVLIHLLAEEPDKLDDPIGRHLSSDWACVKLTDPILSVLETMQSRNLRFVCVADNSGKVVALTGQRGLMEYVADYFSRQVMVERVGTKAYPDKREGA